MANHLRDVFAKNIWGIAAAGLYVVAANAAFGYICPSMWFLGLPCPACGLSRAVLSLLRLDFGAAVLYNPMVFAVPPAVYFYKKRNLTAFAGIAILMFTVFFVRVLTSFGQEPLIINRGALIFIFLGGVL